MTSRSPSLRLIAGRTILLIIAVCFVTLSRVDAQTDVAAASGTHPDIGGFWQPRANSRMGRGAPPQMTPAGAQRAQARREALANGDSGVTEVARWCRALAFPWYFSSSEPWNVIIGPDAIMVLNERQEGSRHIFMDGRSHPDATHLVHTANGDSIGHWEGDTLVVDTIGLKGGVDTTGTYRGPNQHLIERYKLVNQDQLSVSLTWEDPDVYAQPYTTERLYFRSAPNMHAMEDWCDASDESQWHSDANPVNASRKKADQ